MKIDRVKVVLIAAGLIATVIFASVAVAKIIAVPPPPYSEIYILNVEGKAYDIPFNISEGQVYGIRLGVGNHMNTAQTYLIDVEVINQTQPLPTETTGAPSLPIVYQYRAFIENGESWQTTVNFSVSNFSSSIDESTLRSMTVNDSTSNVNLASLWDPQNKGYYYRVLFELWTLNLDTGITQYQNRYVYFWMNVTSTAPQLIDP